MSRVKYDVYNSLRVYPEVIRIGQSKPKLYAKFKVWTAVSFAVLGLLLLYKPVAAFMQGDFRSSGHLVWVFQTLSAFSGH